MTVEVKVSVPVETTGDGKTRKAARVRVVSIVDRRVIQEEIMEHGGELQRYVNEGQRIVIEEVDITPIEGVGKEAGG